MDFAVAFTLTASAEVIKGGVEPDELETAADSERGT